jgi:high-affinity iron transporter
VATIEEAFLGLRVRAGDSQVVPARVESEALRVNALLDRAEERLAGDGGFAVGFWAAFVVLLREGIEAALLLTLLLGSVRRRAAAPDDPGVRSAVRAVHFGWVAALVAGVATWWASGTLIELGGARRELTEGIISLIAAAAMFSASHWILAKLDAKRRVEALKARVNAAQRRAWVVPTLAFLVVYREVFEVVLFLRAIVLDGGGRALPVALGAGVAALALVGFVIALGRFGRRLKPAPLLASAGLMLCLLAVVFAGKGIRSLQEAGLIGITPMRAPRLDVLGMFPTVQTVLAQALFVGLLMASWGWWLRGRLQRGETPPAAADRPA